MQTENGPAGSPIATSPPSGTTDPEAGALGSDSHLAPAARPPTAVVPDWFVPFFRQHHAELISAAMWAGGGARNRPDAEDAVEEVMVRWLTSGRWDDNDGRVIESRVAFFKTAVIRQMWAIHRARKRRREVITDDLESVESCTIDEPNVWEDRHRVLQMLDELPPAQRETVELIFKGFEPQEIAEHLGKKPATVRSNLRHAEERLRSLLVPQPPQPPNDPEASQEEEEAT